MAKNETKLINLILEKKNQTETLNATQYDSYQNLLYSRVDIKTIAFKSSIIFVIADYFLHFNKKKNEKLFILVSTLVSCYAETSLEITQLALDNEVYYYNW